MKALTMTAGAMIACMLAGCASSPPVELKNARAAYQDASRSQGASLASTSMFDAKKSLDRAEAAYSEGGDAAETRDLAYVAERNAVIAKANGGAALAMQQKQVALQDAQRIKQEQAIAMRQQLGQAKSELEKSQQQLESERQARMEALNKIKGLSAKAEERGLVLTLSGSVLFATGKSELMPGARQRLDDVIAALKDDPRSMTIIGHTDSVGSEDKNMALSQKRANAVRTYLVTHGLPENRITAEGMGESKPVADNKTAEGRANNRRVEIILNMTSGGNLPAPGSGSTTTPSGGQPPSGTQSPSSGTPQDGMREQPPTMQTKPMQPQQKP